MSLVTWHPEETLNNFFNTDLIFNGKSSQWRTGAEALLPKVNLTETEDSFNLEAETPGLQDKDIDIKVHNCVLTIKCLKLKKSEKNKENYHIREFSSESFERSFRLSDRVDTEKISAKIENGILKVDLPKHEQMKPIKIEVES